MILINHPLFFWHAGVLLAVILVYLSDGAAAGKLLLLADHFLYEYDYKNIAHGVLFSLVFMIRFPILCMLFISQKIRNGERFSHWLCLVYGFFMGYLFFGLWDGCGLKGAGLTVLLWTPHMYFYMYAIYRLIRIEPSMRKKKMLMCLIYMFGVVSEVYLNPLLMKALVPFL